MAFSKIIFNGDTLMDVTNDTVTSNTLLTGSQATGADGQKVQGGYTPTSDTFVLEYETDDDGIGTEDQEYLWLFDSTYADIKAAIQAGKTFKLTSLGDDAIGMVETPYAYKTNYRYQHGNIDTTFTECICLWLTKYTGANRGLYYVVHGYINASTMRQYAHRTSLSPEGTINITDNGTVDVTSYASASVNVSGSGGLEYEYGTYTPTEDVTSIDIEFTNTHSKAPDLIVMSQAAAGGNTTYSNMLFMYCDMYKLFGSSIFWGTSSTSRSNSYALTLHTSSTSANTAVSNRVRYSSDVEDPESTDYARYWATETGFKAVSTNTSTRWRSGVLFKWIAIWGNT